MQVDAAVPAPAVAYGVAFAGMAHDPSVTVKDIAGRVVAALAVNEWKPLGSCDADVDDDLAETIVCLATSGPIDEHGIGWNPAGWTSGIRAGTGRLARGRFLVPHIDRVAGMAEPGTGSAVVVRRRHLFDLAGSDPVDFYVGVMAWGFGSTGYGWWRTAGPAARLGEAGLRSAVDELRRAAGKGAAEAFGCWSLGGAGKLPGVGTAFASKLAYFAGWGRSGTSPLIADANTAWALWAFTGIWDSRVARSHYVAYVDVAHRWAGQVEGRCRTDEVERALFVLGPPIATAWRKAHPKKSRSRG